MTHSAEHVGKLSSADGLGLRTDGGGLRTDGGALSSVKGTLSDDEGTLSSVERSKYFQTMGNFVSAAEHFLWEVTCDDDESFY